MQLHPPASWKPPPPQSTPDQKSPHGAMIDDLMHSFVRRHHQRLSGPKASSGYFDGSRSIDDASAPFSCTSKNVLMHAAATVRPRRASIFPIVPDCRGIWPLISRDLSLKLKWPESRKVTYCRPGPE